MDYFYLGGGKPPPQSPPKRTLRLRLRDWILFFFLRLLSFEFTSSSQKRYGPGRFFRHQSYPPRPSTWNYGRHAYRPGSARSYWLKAIISFWLEMLRLTAREQRPGLWQSISFPVKMKICSLEQQPHPAPIAGLLSDYCCAAVLCPLFKGLSRVAAV